MPTYENREPRAGDLWASKDRKNHIVMFVGRNYGEKILPFYLNRFDINAEQDPEVNCPEECEDFDVKTWSYIGRISPLLMALEEKLVAAIEKGEL